MNNAVYHVNRLNKNHIEKIEQIWVNSLPDNLKSIIGYNTIKRYLEIFFTNQNVLGTGVFKSDALIGFVLYGDDSYILKKIIRENILKVIFSFLVNLLKLNIKNLIRYINVFFFMILSKNKEHVLKKDNTELLIIAVKKDENNKGLGSLLINETLLKNLEYFTNFKYILVKTLISTPKNIQFYKKNDFNVVLKIFGRIYLKRKL